MSDSLPPDSGHQRRKRYSGKNPRSFEEKYKEHQPERYAETVAKVIAAGKTPAGQHLPIMVEEILQVLDLRAGQRCVDCTLGYGGHARELLAAVQPGGSLLGLDQDPVEILRTEERLLGLELPGLLVRRVNFAGLLHALAEVGWGDGVDGILADLGVSSMQIDNPERGFSFKLDGPLDMRMNPQRGLPARVLLQRCSAETLAEWLNDFSDEPRARVLALALAGRDFPRTLALRQAVLAALPKSVPEEECQLTLRRVFQALRIAVNDELGVLETWLRALPQALRAGGRVAVLTFHSGEDRRVKKAFQAGLRDGIYSAVSEEVGRAGGEERQLNPRASSAKLRWAVRS
jgi:16S rRNA (cytosine1402-N4)-methyltransferase